jgi:hypothetical protein
MASRIGVICIPHMGQPPFPQEQQDEGVPGGTSGLPRRTEVARIHLGCSGFLGLTGLPTRPGKYLGGVFPVYPGVVHTLAGCVFLVGGVAIPRCPR